MKNLRYKIPQASSFHISGWMQEIQVTILDRFCGDLYQYRY